MMKLSAVTLLMLIEFSPISAQSQNDTQQARQQAQGSTEVPKPPELFIDSMKKTVVFLQTPFLQNGQPKSWDGTGFLIIAPDSRLKDRGVVWLVTNKHMIRSPVGPYFNSVGVRINTKVPLASGNQFTEGTLPVLDPAGNLYWCTDPNDETVDLALFQVSLNEAELDAEWLPTDSFTTKDTFKKLKINENDEVLFAGLFNAYRGSKRNFPIVRHGKLALVTDERIPIDPRQGSTVDLILAEVTSFGGNSGSPVFLRVGGVREGAGVSIGGYSYYLLGVMQGFFSEGAEIALDITTSLRGTVRLTRCFFTRSVATPKPKNWRLELQQSEKRQTRLSLPRRDADLTKVYCVFVAFALGPVLGKCDWRLRSKERRGATNCPVCDNLELWKP